MNYDPAKRYFVTKLLASKGLGNGNKDERNALHHERSQELHSNQIDLANQRFNPPRGELAKIAMDRRGG